MKSTVAMEARRRMLREEYADLRDAYREARPARGQFIDARLLNVTGAILHDLEAAGFVERDGSRYRPKR